MRRSAVVSIRILVVASLVVAVLFNYVLIGSAANRAPIAVDQGGDWTPAKRDEFYSLDQGSRIMPLSWINALKLPDGTPFMADSLRRYGFLPNDASPARLPVGFTAAGQPGDEAIGMTCAACHTRQIEFDDKAYRIDGGPAIIDFQSFVSDLDVAVDTVLQDAAVFADFARSVLGGTPMSADQAALRQAVADWHFRYHTLMANALPKDNPWGPGRADAIGMIFNRLTGLDLGLPPSHVIKENIERADAPVRYPFLWNAHKQALTQWPGIAANDAEIFRMFRNIGQVLGVFADFLPQRNPVDGSIDYWAINSINVKGLSRLEALMTRIGPPRWPWPLDDKLAERGRKIYSTHCDHCHKAKPIGKVWETPVQNVNTDTRQLTLLERRAKTGILEASFQKEDTAWNILTLTVFQMCIDPLRPHACESSAVKSREGEVKRMGRSSSKGYEARVLRGVWAAAPYLHNGSVPTLVELLKPAAERIASFKSGPAYDPVAVGLAKEQPSVSATLTTTDCSDRSSGNSRCGHEYGTTLQAGEKQALLEYLKKL
jgi:RoxA-like, cytochrome c-like